MGEKPEFIKILTHILSEINESLESIRSVGVVKSDAINFDLCVLCAYLKSFDYLYFIINRAEPKDSYFYLPGLRSICEDLIVLSYLLKKPRVIAESYFLTKRFEELSKSINAQKTYFHKFNPNQKVLSEIQSIDKIIQFQNKIQKRSDLEKKDLPNIFQMATSVGLEDIYKFIYHATSKSVHFDITSLFKTAWGDFNSNRDLNITIRHDHEINYRHTYTFIIFYSLKLFHDQSKAFKELLELPQELIVLLDLLIEKFEKNNKEWPPIISFEEMNLINRNFN